MRAPYLILAALLSTSACSSVDSTAGDTPTAEGGVRASPAPTSVDPTPSSICEDLERLEEQFVSDDSADRTVRAATDAVARLRDDAPGELVDLIGPWLRLITSRADPTGEGANAAPNGYLFSAPPEVLRWSDAHCGTALEERATAWPD